MPTIADLIGQAAAERLAALQAQAGQHQADAEAVPVQPATCRSCGQRLPAPAVMFSSGEVDQGG